MDKWTEKMKSTPPEELLEEMKAAMKQNGLPLNQRAKSYKISVRDKKDIARLVINFLNCTLMKKREAGVLNTKDEPKYLPGYYVPYNAYAGKYDQRNVPSREELESVLEKNDYMIQCMAAFDREDAKRIGMMKFPTEDSFLCLNLYFPDYDEYKVMRIIKYIEETE